jgi:phosphoglycolate phosphatase
MGRGTAPRRAESVYLPAMARAILFDLDGTLVDSLDDIAAALVGAVVDRGLPAPTRAQVRGWIGGGARRLVERAVPPDQVDPVLARFRARYADAPVVHTRVYPGVDAILDRMAAAGHPLAVVTNKPHDLAVAICRVVLAPWPFAAVAGHRAGHALKPSPEPVLAVARELGAAPATCALVGDAGTDIAAARAAGMTAVGVTWGYGRRADLAGAQLVCDEPAQLLALIL